MLLAGLLAITLSAQAVPDSATKVGGDSSPKATSKSTTSLRLDAPPTRENSFPFDFGNGVVMQVPRILLSSSSTSKDPNQPIKREALSMVFWYPDMTPTNWVSQMDTILDKSRGTYLSQKNRFRVRIIWMWYTPPDSDNFAPGSQQPSFRFEPRPPRIEMNRACCGAPQLRRVSAGIPGLDRLIAEKTALENPAAAKRDPSSPGDYVAKPASPYELSMRCDGAERGVQCMAHVYSKKHHLQYRMVFTPEPVERTDELIRAIDKMIDRWISG
jgi:hypothetical protein